MNREQAIAHPRPVRMKEAKPLEDALLKITARIPEDSDLRRLSYFLAGLEHEKVWITWEEWGVAIWYKGDIPGGVRIHFDFDHDGKLIATEAI